MSTFNRIEAELQELIDLFSELDPATCNRSHLADTLSSLQDARESLEAASSEGSVDYGHDE